MPAIGSALSSLGNRAINAGRMLFGRAPVPPPRPFEEMGTSGTAVYGGYVQVKERSPEWIGRQKWITISDLAVNTSIIAAGVHYFLNLVASSSWTFSPHDEHDEESLALAEFAQHVLNDMVTPWNTVVRRACIYRFHGFGIQEWTAKHRDDGLIGFKDIESRPQQTIEQWDVDIDGSVLGVWQRSPQTGNLLGIPRDKVIYCVEDTLTDSPEGIGMFRHMADPWKRLKQLQDLEMRGYERDLRGTPIAKAPLTLINRAMKSGSLTSEQGNALVNAFEGLVRLQVKQSDTGIVMDSLPYFSDSDAGQQVSAVPQWGFELLSGAGVGYGEIAAAIERVQTEIARIIGVESLMMGGGKSSGNRSLGEDKTRNLYLVANAVLKYLGQRVQSDILVPLWRLNGFPMKKMPKASPEDVTFKNAATITGCLSQLAQAGAVLSPNDPVVNDVRDILGVERQPHDIAAQGAATQPNAILAGMPPELQARAMGGGDELHQHTHQAGSGAPLPDSAFPTANGGTPGVPGVSAAGAGPSSSPFGGKSPFGGGAGFGGGMPKRPKMFPGKRFTEVSKTTIVRPKEEPVFTPVKPGDEGKPPPDDAGIQPTNVQGSDDQHFAEAKGQPTVNGLSKPGAAQGDRAQLIQLLEQLLGRQSAVDGSQQTPDSTHQPAIAAPDHQTVRPASAVTPAAHVQPPNDDSRQPAASAPAAHAALTQHGASASKPTAAAKPTKHPPAAIASAQQPKPNMAAQPQASAAPHAHPAAAPASQAKPAANAPVSAKQPQAAPAAGVAKPAAPKQPQQPKPGSAAAVPGANAGPNAAHGQQPPTVAQPGQQQPQQPGQPAAPGQPPAPGQSPGIGGLGGSNRDPQQEMTPERASEILQPYADPTQEPQDDQPQSDSDMLYVRLGHEKDVQPAVSDQDPLDALTRLLGGGGPAQPGDGTDGADQPDDGGSADTQKPQQAGQPALLSRQSAGDPLRQPQKPQAAPVKPKRPRVRF